MQRPPKLIQARHIRPSTLTVEPRAKVPLCVFRSSSGCFLDPLSRGDTILWNTLTFCVKFGNVAHSSPASLVGSYGKISVGMFVIVLGEICEAAIVIGRGRRIEPNCIGAIGDGAIIFALGNVSEPAVFESISKFQVKPDRFGVIGDRTVGFPQLKPDDTAIVERRSAFRVEPDRLVIVGDRVVEIPLAAVCQTAVIECPRPTSCSKSRPSRHQSSDRVRGHRILCTGRSAAASVLSCFASVDFLFREQLQIESLPVRIRYGL